MFSEEEVKKIVKYIITKNGLAEGLIDVTAKQKSVPTGALGSPDLDDDDDELFPEAMEIVIDNKKASTSLLQRKLKIGYSRAARLIDLLEEKGIVGPADGSRPREILVDSKWGI